MPKRRQRPQPDLRLSWRDPNMPVLNKHGKPVPHEKMQLKAQIAMTYADEPSWRNDPTYNLAKRKAKP